MRHPLKRSAAFLILACGGATIAQAAQFPHREPAFPERAYTCRFEGTDVPLGGRRCLATPHGQQVAECGIALNMSSWRPEGASCP